MSLILPGVGTEPGPQYATEINGSLTIIDSHSHVLGQGVQITPGAININADLSFNNYSSISLAGTTYTPQVTLPVTLDTIYVSGTELFFLDGSGNHVQITMGGAVNATSFGISSGTATAAFVSGVLVVNAAPTLPADIQCASILLGNNVPSSNFVTLSPPSALASNYGLVLPQLPTIPQATPQPAPILVDTSGNMQPGNSYDYFMPAGLIMAYGGATTPTGWLLCDGSAVSRTTYANLFSAIGTSWGSGDGFTTFNIPDCRGLFLRGVSGGSGRDPDAASRTAVNPGGNSGNSVGSYEADQYRSHSHGVSDPGHSHTALCNNSGPGGETRILSVGPGGAGNAGGSAATITNSGSSGIQPANTGVSINLSGGNETRPINVNVNYIVKY